MALIPHHSAGRNERAGLQADCTCPSNVNIRGEDGKESNTKQENQEARFTMPEQLTFDGAARSSMAGYARLQAHKIESM